jgi:nucleoside-diphosphate-sugar epimerase
MKIIILGNTSMIAKRIRRQVEGLGTVWMAGRSGEADIRFSLDGEYAFDGRIGKVDAIVHCAASFEGNEMEGAARNELVNAAGAFRVAQLARDTKCAQVVYLSSISIYDHPENGYFGSYGLSKRHGQENLDWACRQLGVAFASLAASQVYDEFGDARKHQAMFYRIMDAARKGEDVTFYGEADPERNFLFAGDLAEIVRRVIQQRITGIHPVVHPKSNRLSEIAEAAFRVFGQGGKTIFRKDKPNLPAIHVPARTDLYEQIGYAPETGLAAGIAMIKENLRPA